MGNPILHTADKAGGLQNRKKVGEAIRPITNMKLHKDVSDVAKLLADIVENPIFSTFDVHFQQIYGAGKKLPQPFGLNPDASWVYGGFAATEMSGVIAC